VLWIAGDSLDERESECHWVSGILWVRYAVWLPLLRIVLNTLKRGSNSPGGREDREQQQNKNNSWPLWSCGRHGRKQSLISTTPYESALESIHIAVSPKYLLV